MSKCTDLVDWTIIVFTKRHFDVFLVAGSKKIEAYKRLDRIVWLSDSVKDVFPQHKISPSKSLNGKLLKKKRKTPET